MSGTRIRRQKMLTRSKQSGITLVEILVTVLIFSVGIIGLTGLQSRAVKGSVSSIQRSQAMMYGYYMLDVMRIDRINVKDNAYDVSKTCDVSDFSGSTLAQKSLAGWLTLLKTNIGKIDDETTCVEINCDEYTCTLKIIWDDERAGGFAEQELLLSTEI